MDTNKRCKNNSEENIFDGRKKNHWQNNFLFGKMTK